MAGTTAWHGAFGALAPAIALLGVVGRLLVQVSDGLDEVWEPFLDDR